jgi:hypothetical protein
VLGARFALVKQLSPLSCSIKLEVSCLLFNVGVDIYKLPRKNLNKPCYPVFCLGAGTIVAKHQEIQHLAGTESNAIGCNPTKLRCLAAQGQEPSNQVGK